MPTSFRQNIEGLHFNTVVVNAILNGCSFAIATDWSNVVEVLIDFLFGEDEGVSGRMVLRRLGTALMTTCVLCLLSGLTLKLGGAWTRVKSAAIEHITEEWIKLQPPPSKVVLHRRARPVTFQRSKTVTQTSE